MSEFRPSIINLNDINGGQRYNNGDGVGAEAINSAIEASAFAQAIATNQPNVANVSGNGTPSVSIETLENGTTRLKFENLIGPQGEKGDNGVSSTWYTGKGEPQKLYFYKSGDMYLNTLNGQVYRYNGTDWVSTVNIMGPQGEGGTDIEANPTEEATDELLTVKIGDKTYYIPKGVDVQINGTSIVENGVANIPVAGALATQKGVVFANANYGVRTEAGGDLRIYQASEAEIDAGEHRFRPITPYRINYAVKKGVTANTIVLTEDEKQTAQDWLGISGGTQLYKHEMIVKSSGMYGTFTFLSTSSEANVHPYPAFASIPREFMNTILFAYGSTEGTEDTFATNFVQGASGEDFCIIIEGSGIRVINAENFLSDIPIEDVEVLTPIAL